MDGVLGVKKTLNIELDLITSKVTVNNSEDMTYIEIMTALEYAKMMMMRDWLETEGSDNHV